MDTLFFFSYDSRIKDVQKDLDETRDVMVDNIDAMIANVEKAEVIDDKTGNL